MTANFLEECQAYCSQHGTPDRLEVLLSDLNGVFRGKWLPGHQIEKLAEGQVKLPFSTYAASTSGHEVSQTGLGIVVGDPDGILVPVSGSLSPVPWAKYPTAQVLVDLQEPNGEPSDLSPRRCLERVLERFAAQALQPVVAAELEFYTFRPRASAEAPPVPPEHTPAAQNYDMACLDRAQAWLDALEVCCRAQRIASDTITAEYGPGQFEVNFCHGGAMAAADQVALFRRATRATLAAHGLEGSFMAKPYADQPGNGFHLHVSVEDREGRNIFAGTAQEGLPFTLGAAVAGVLETMRPLQAIFAPNQNSYRRFGPNSFAPTAPEWGIDDRSVAVRLVDIDGPNARLEHRIAGADANPYLVIAGILDGVLSGIEGQLTPPPPIHADPAPAPLLRDWAGALDLFEASPIATKLFGDRFVHVLTAMKRHEIDNITSVIPPQEYATYLCRF